MTKKLKSLNQPETKLLGYLRKHPELFERLNEIVALSEGKEGTILNANETESLLIEELRKLGTTTLHEWGRHAEACVGEQFQTEHPGSYCGKKKRLSWLSTFGFIEIE